MQWATECGHENKSPFNSVNFMFLCEREVGLGEIFCQIATASVFETNGGSLLSDVTWIDVERENFVSGQLLGTY